MANVLNKTTGQFLKSVNEPDYPQDEWIWAPDLSAFSVIGGYNSKYVVLPATNPVQIMSEQDRALIDEQEAAQDAVNVKTEVKQTWDINYSNTKPLSLLLLNLYNEIKNSLKADAVDSPLPDLTEQDIKNLFETIVDGN